ncbi:MAG: hypothetical protein QG608_3564 [Actinomycetota bacterium]|nr:hypothetical protein [Actinomycetota bacterium]
MRIALVGPAHPFKGGVAAHTTETAHRLSAAGHRVDLVSWSRLYPRLLYPGEQAVPNTEPDLPPFEHTIRPLRWDRPGTWWRTGRRLRGHDLVILVVVVPAQIPALLTVARAATRGRGALAAGTAGAGPRIALIVHNVAPHESHPGASTLVRRLLRAADLSVVHTPEQAERARELGAADVAVSGLPPHLPGGTPTPAERAESIRRRQERDPADPVRLLCFGLVRHYKGVDLLLQALRDVPGITLGVHGELWGQAGDRVLELSHDPALAGRVRLESGYVPAGRIREVLAEHDVLALPYRSATASQNVHLAHAHGLPVLASAVGNFPSQVRPGVDGLVVPPGDVPALARALRELTDPTVLATLRAGVADCRDDDSWDHYVTALTRQPR